MKYISFLIKPASASCNMRCRYCFYADVAEHRAVRSHGVMGTDVMDGTATVYLAVAGDIEVVANLSKTTLQVATAQSLDREIDIATRRAAMDYQEADLPVVLVEAAGYHPAQALTPKAPAMALATAMITLRTMPHTVLGFFSICE